MNKIILTFAIVAYLAATVYSQSDSVRRSRKIAINPGEIRPDTSVITLKKRDILVIRNPIRHAITKSGDTSLYHQKKKAGFRGTWTGIEFGMNNYLSDNRTLTLQQDAKPIELKTFRSWEINWNIMKKSYTIYKNRFGIVTGLGLAFNNYSFDKQVIFISGSTPEKFSIDTISKLKKNKMAISYLTIPLMFEYQIPLGKSRLHISSGIIGNVRLKSKIKQVDDQDNKFVYRGTYNLSPYKLDGTLRIGYGHLSIYTNYGLTQLFRNDKGPRLYPYSIGLGLTF